MFDIGFSEIVVIAVVALIVIGPERLPKTARTLGHLFGRLQRYVSQVKADINREMEAADMPVAGIYIVPNCTTPTGLGAWPARLGSRAAEMAELMANELL